MLYPIEKYGKPIIKELLDNLIIKKSSSEEIKKILIKHNILKPKSKAHISVSFHLGGYLSLTINNGKNSQLIGFYIPQYEMQEFFKELNG